MHVRDEQGFGKFERLCSKNDIQELFTKGSSFYFAPLRVKYLRAEGDSHRVLISVPKRLFKKAVDRNLVKRRIREAYRRNKGSILSLPSMHIAFVVAKSDPIDQSAIDKAVQVILTKLGKDESDIKH